MPPVGLKVEPRAGTFSGVLGALLLLNDEGVLTVNDMTQPALVLWVQPAGTPSSALTKM